MDVGHVRLQREQLGYTLRIIGAMAGRKGNEVPPVSKIHALQGLTFYPLSDLLQPQRPTLTVTLYSVPILMYVFRVWE